MDNPIEILYFSSTLFDRQAQINKLNEDNSYLIKLNDKYTNELGRSVINEEIQMECEEVNKQQYTHPKYWYQCKEQADIIFTPLLETYEIEIKKLQRNILNFQTKYSELSAEVDETKSTIQTLRMENKNLKDEYDKILANSNCSEKSCHNYITILQTEIKKYKNQYEDISKLYDNSKLYIEKLTDERDKAESKVNESSEVLKKIKEDLKEILIQKNTFELENKKLKEDNEIVINSTIDIKNENNKLNKDIINLTNKYEKLNEENEMLNLEYDTLLKSYEKDSKDLINTNMQNSGLKNIIDDLKIELSNIQKQQQVQVETMKLLNKKLENTENEKQLYQRKHSELLNINAILTRDNESKTISEKNMRYKYCELENSTQKQLYSTKLEYENKFKENEKKYKQLIEELKDMIKNNKSNNNNNNNNNSINSSSDYSLNYNNNDNYSNKIKKIIEEWELMKNKYQNEIDQLNDKYKSLQTQYQSANQKNVELSHQLDESNNKISLLQHQVESLKSENSGYRDIQKEVIVNSNKINGLLNSNAELETKYKISISEKNMLNNNLNHLQLIKDEGERNLNSQIIKLKQMNYDLAQKLNELTNQNNIITHELAELKKQISIEQIQQDVHSLYTAIELPLPSIDETK